MRKLFLMAILIASAAPLTFAQTASDDYNKLDVYAGFSHNRVDTGLGDDDPDLDDIFDEREGYNGVEASVTGNVSRYFGVKADYSFHRNEIDFGADSTDFRIHNFLGGVQFKDNAKETKVKPFAHLLAGVAHQSVDLTDLDNTFTDFSETGFAAAIGGGLDFRVSDRVDVRAIQFDYNPNHINGNTQHNFRVGVGVVFR